jgi:hypothetical protein
VILCHLGHWCFWVYCVTHSTLSVGYTIDRVALRVSIVVWDVGTCSVEAFESIWAELHLVTMADCLGFYSEHGCCAWC